MKKPNNIVQVINRQAAANANAPTFDLYANSIFAGTVTEEKHLKAAIKRLEKAPKLKPLNAAAAIRYMKEWMEYTAAKKTAEDDLYIYFSAKDREKAPKLLRIDRRLCTVAFQYDIAQADPCSAPEWDYMDAMSAAADEE